jgi:hypothetical protein
LCRNCHRGALRRLRAVRSCSPPDPVVGGKARPTHGDRYRLSSTWAMVPDLPNGAHIASWAMEAANWPIVATRFARASSIRTWWSISSPR